MDTLITAAVIALTIYMIGVLFKSFKDDMNGMTEEKLHDMKEITEDENFHK